MNDNGNLLFDFGGDEPGAGSASPAHGAPASRASDESALRAPLAARMRPETLADIAGQDHILGPGKLLRRIIETDRLSSVIFNGQPG